MTVRIAIVEDQALLATALVAALEQCDDVDVVAHVRAAEALDGGLDHVDADVVVMSWASRDVAGVEIAEAVNRALPGSAVIALAARPDEELLLQAIAVGCEGLVSKDATLDELHDAVMAVGEGMTAYHPVVPRPTCDHTVDLTPRERDVLRCLAEGLSTREMAARLDLSWHTVRTHVRNVLGKLGAHSRVAAVATARRRGLLPTDPLG